MILRDSESGTLRIAVAAMEIKSLLDHTFTRPEYGHNPAVEFRISMAKKERRGGGGVWRNRIVNGNAGNSRRKNGYSFPGPEGPLFGGLGSARVNSCPDTKPLNCAMNLMLGYPKVRRVSTALARDSGAATMLVLNVRRRHGPSPMRLTIPSASGHIPGSSWRPTCPKRWSGPESSISRVRPAAVDRRSVSLRERVR